MKGILFVTLLTGAVVGLSATCQQDFEQCKKTYNDALPKTAGHPAALCMVGNTYISCLRKLAARTDCASILPQISDARRKTEEMLNRNVTGCMLCTKEVDQCEAAFKNSSSLDSHNITAVCKDTQNLVDCLVRVSGKAECAAELSRVQENRRKADEHLNQCHVRENCQSGIHVCEVKQAAAKKTSTTHAQECKVADAYYHCLLGLEHTCSGDSQKDLKMAVDSVLAEAKAGHCPFTIDGAEALAPRSLVTLVVSLLVVALTAKLN